VAHNAGNGKAKLHLCARNLHRIDASLPDLESSASVHVTGYKVTGKLLTRVACLSDRDARSNSENEHGYPPRIDSVLAS
jgi:hypothetical protein